MDSDDRNRAFLSISDRCILLLDLTISFQNKESFVFLPFLLNHCYFRGENMKAADNEQNSLSYKHLSKMFRIHEIQVLIVAVIPGIWCLNAYFRKLSIIVYDNYFRS